MNKLYLFFLLNFITTCIVAQQQTFDVISYSVPPGGGWKKEEKNNVVVFTKTDKSTNTWCQIGVYRSTAGKGNIESDLQSEWNELAAKPYSISDPMQPTEIKELNGWKMRSASGKFNFNNKDAAIILTTYSSGDRCVSIMATTNSAKYLENIESFASSVKLKSPTSQVSNNGSTGNQTNTTGQNQQANQQTENTTAGNTSFAFSNTNFDDGWKSTIAEDWVEVKKGNMKVLLHYPKAGTIFPADPGPMTNAAWNILTAPRYSNLKNYKTSYIATYDRPYLGMGYATENATGKNVFVLIFHRGHSGWIEFVSPDKNTFIQQFKFDPESIQWDSDDKFMDPLEDMSVYNKFGIAASDFKGKWTSDFTGIQQLYSVYTGQYAGMNINQSNEEFIFKPGNSYSWKMLAVNGMVGNIRAVEVKSAGQFTVLNNWQIKFSKIENNARTFNAFWSCIKGARILNLLDANAPGSGIYTKYGMAK